MVRPPIGKQAMTAAERQRRRAMMKARKTEEEEAREEGRRDGRAEVMLNPHLAWLHSEYQRVLDWRGGPFMTPADFRLILRALYDAQGGLSDLKRAEALATFRKYRLLLVNEDVEPTPKPPERAKTGGRR